MINSRIAGSRNTLYPSVPRNVSRMRTQDVSRSPRIVMWMVDLGEAVQVSGTGIWIDQQPTHVSSPLARARATYLGPPLNSGEATVGDLAPGQAFPVGGRLGVALLRVKRDRNCRSGRSAFSFVWDLSVCHRRKLVLASLETLLDYASPFPLLAERAPYRTGGMVWIPAEWTGAFFEGANRPWTSPF